MSQPITVFVDSGRAVARLSGPLILGDSYSVAFSGLSTAEAAASPEIVVLGPKPGEIAARSGSGKVLAMTTRPCADVFRLPPPPPFPKEFPNPPPTAPRPLHPRGGPHASAPMHFYVVAGGQTLAQGDLVLLWAPFEYDAAGNPIQLQGEKGDKGDKGDTGAQGEPGRNGVYVAMDGLYAFHISERGDHPEDGHLWIHAQDESRLYAHDENGNYLTDSEGKRIPLYYIDGRGHLLYRFFYKDATHTELDLGRVVTREGLYAFHVSDGTDGEPDGHLMMHGQDLSQLYATDADGELILDGDGNPIPLFHIDTDGHLIYTFYGVDGQVHATLDIGDVRGLPLTWDDLTEAQKASLKGETGATGAQGPKGDPLTWSDLTPEQKAALKGEKGDPGEDGMSADEIVALVNTTMGRPDDEPIAGSGTWVTSGGLWSVEMAILARIAALASRIDGIRATIAGAYVFKGSVDEVNDLPSDGNEVGDVWNVRQDATHPDGMNYAWTGTEWDALGGLGDLSAYALKSEVAAALAEGKGYTDNKVGDLYGTVTDIGQTALSASQTATAAYQTATAASQTATAALNAANAKPSAQDVSDAISTAIGNVGNFSTVAFDRPGQQTPGGSVTAYGPTDTITLYADGDLSMSEASGSLNKGIVMSVSVMGASLPSGVQGSNLGAWVSMVDMFLGQLPGSSDIITQDTNGDLHKGSPYSADTKLTDAPKIDGTPLALGGHTHASLVSADTETTVTANNDGTLSITKPGAEIDETDPLSSLADYLELGDNATLNDVRTALGLSDTATLDDARQAVPTSINDVFTTKTYVDDALATKANASAIRYDLATATPTVSGTTATVACADRAITTAAIGASITSVAFLFPAAAQGKARDFFVRLDCAGANVANFSFPPGVTIDFGLDDIGGLTQKAGIHLVLFTEIAASHWLASVKKAES